jgi:tetratricopeptide (TPR) repeat protein
MKKESKLLRQSGKRIPTLAVTAALTVLAACSSSPATAPDPVPPVSDAADADRELSIAPSGLPADVPEEVLAAHASGVAAINAGDWTRAEIEFEQLAFEYPSLPGPYINLAIIHRHYDRYDDARLALETAIGIAPDHAIANSELGILLRESGEFAAAEAAYRRAIAADPDYALAHYNLGVLLEVYLRRESEALEQFETYQALLSAPDAEVGRWVVDLRRRLGVPAEPLQVAQEGGL